MTEREDKGVVDAEYTEREPADQGAKPDESTKEVAVKRQDPETEVMRESEAWQMMKAQSKLWERSGLLPDKMKPSEAIIVASYGRSAGLTFAESLCEVYLVQNKPALSAKAMKALVQRKYPESDFRTVEESETQVVVEFTKYKGDAPRSYKFTRAMADRMGATTKNKYEKQPNGRYRKVGTEEKDNWRKLPEDMLYWRCISKICRREVPDALMGLAYTPEELGAEVNSSGNPLRRVDRTEGDALADELNSKLLGDKSEKTN